MIPKLIKSSLEKFFGSTGVRLYGTKEEYEAATGRNYLEQGIFNTNLSAIDWLEASVITKKILNKKINPNHLLKEPRLKDIRVIGAGIQNVVSVAEWVAFLRSSLSKEGIRLVTFFIMPEHKTNYIEGMRCSMKGEEFSFGGPKELNFNLPGKIIDRGVLMNKNMSSLNCNVVNGCRANSELVDSGKTGGRFLFFGASEVFGTFLKDDQTISAQFQALLGVDLPGVCVNYGMGGVNFIDVVSRIIKTSKRKSDTVFLAVPYSDSMSHVDLVIQLEENELVDYSHPNKNGAKKAAMALFKKLQTDQDFAFANSAKHDACLSCIDVYQKHMIACESLEFKTGALKKDLEYFNAAREKYVPSKGTVGSVAVNCNPITLGHEHLIDYARSKVDVLFVLVIEEDLSAVSFKDRYELVSLVCKDKPNVVVLRGGSFVCTEYISPEYFIKDEVKSEVADFSLESFYFGHYIGPALGIQKVFLGDEPKCAITRQYNEHMKLAMPAYDIELEIIPRVGAADGNVISASYVRLLISNGDFDQLSNYVPSICIPYLSSENFKLRPRG